MSKELEERCKKILENLEDKSFDDIFFEAKDTTTKKYNIKDLMENTDFEAHREDRTLREWQEKPLIGKELIKSVSRAKKQAKKVNKSMCKYIGE